LKKRFKISGAFETEWGESFERIRFLECDFIVYCSLSSNSPVTELFDVVTHDVVLM